MAPTRPELDFAYDVFLGIKQQTPERIALARSIAYRSYDYKLVALADLHNGPGVPFRLIAAIVVSVAAAGIALAWWLA